MFCTAWKDKNCHTPGVTTAFAAMHGSSLNEFALAQIVLQWPSAFQSKVQTRGKWVWLMALTC